MPRGDDVTAVTHQMKHTHVVTEVIENGGEKVNVARRLLCPPSHRRRHRGERQRRIETIELEVGRRFGFLLKLARAECVGLVIDCEDVRMGGENRQQQRGPGSARGADYDSRSREAAAGYSIGCAYRYRQRQERGASYLPSP